MTRADAGQRSRCAAHRLSGRCPCDRSRCTLNRSGCASSRGRLSVRRRSWTSRETPAGSCGRSSTSRVRARRRRRAARAGGRPCGAAQPRRTARVADIHAGPPFLPPRVPRGGGWTVRATPRPAAWSPCSPPWSPTSSGKRDSSACTALRACAGSSASRRGDGSAPRARPARRRAPRATARPARYGAPGRLADDPRLHQAQRRGARTRPLQRAHAPAARGRRRRGDDDPRRLGVLQRRATARRQARARGRATGRPTLSTSTGRTGSPRCGRSSTR
jgi:hypothetical protein